MLLLFSVEDDIAEIKMDNAATEYKNCHKDSSQSQLTSSPDLVEKILEKSPLNDIRLNAIPRSNEFYGVKKSRRRELSQCSQNFYLGNMRDRDTQVGMMKSISITLPNQLSHKLRKRIYTATCTGREHEEVSWSNKTERETRDERSVLDPPSNNLTSVVKNLASYHLSEGADQKNLQSSLESLEDPQPGLLDPQAGLEGLLSRCTEIEERNRVWSTADHMKRFYDDLPGIGDLAKRHQNLDTSHLLPTRQDGHYKLEKRRRQKKIESCTERTSRHLEDYNSRKNRQVLPILCYSLVYNSQERSYSNLSLV